MLQAYKQVLFKWPGIIFYFAESTVLSDPIIFFKDSSEGRTKSGLLSLLIILPDVLLIIYLITASIYNTIPNSEPLEYHYLSL